MQTFLARLIDVVRGEIHPKHFLAKLSKAVGIELDSMLFIWMKIPVALIGGIAISGAVLAFLSWRDSGLEPFFLFAMVATIWFVADQLLPEDWFMGWNFVSTFTISMAIIFGVAFAATAPSLGAIVAVAGAIMIVGLVVIAWLNTAVLLGNEVGGIINRWRLRKLEQNDPLIHKYYQVENSVFSTPDTLEGDEEVLLWAATGRADGILHLYKSKTEMYIDLLHRIRKSTGERPVNAWAT